MKSKSDFWLSLHKLADDLHKEGSTDDDRSAALIDVLESLTPATVEAYMENLTSVTSSLNHLVAACKLR
jgi:hypothetical protein